MIKELLQIYHLVWTDPGNVGRVTLIQVFFTTYEKYFKYHRHSVVNQKYNLSFTLLGLPLKKWNFPQVHHLKTVFENNFLRLTATACFQKNECFKNVNFLTLFFSQ